MGARQSAAMAKAKELITEGGQTAYAAAKATGLTRSAIYMSTWYKAWRASQSKSMTK